jgi:arabinogalactan oligomer/maltooligosaccharide transport system permease protein
VWAALATLTTFIGGVLLAKLINSKMTKLPVMWRTLFVVAIAVPQFVTLLLVRNFFADSGIVNTICSNIGLTGFLKSIGLVSSNLNYIPFLTQKNWAKVMIILINIWVGVPYQMLIATGVLMNIPEDQIESARIDGANAMQIFWKIIMPYVLFIQGPALITDFVKNINNFNVIYLLTQDVYTTTDQAMASSNAKEVDLLVTWLFRLTNEYYNYKMASVIGIIVFIICAVFTLLSFSRMIAGDREGDFQK